MNLLLWVVGNVVVVEVADLGVRLVVETVVVDSVRLG